MTAQPIWYDGQGRERNSYGLFRRTFTCAAAPARCELHLFADTVYHLHVNGRFVNLGPARFDPRFPLYDSHDLSPHLRPGRNVIAVMVNHFGCETYKSIPARAGLVAWGEVVEANGQRQALATGTDGQWLAVKCQAYDGDAPRLSFALNPMEIVDQARLAAGWQGADFDDSAWPAAPVLEGPPAWGPLVPRSIPLLTTAEVAAERIVGVLPLQPAEDVYAFKVPVLDFYTRERGVPPPVIAFSTWIFSPADQPVTAGRFWGEHWLNGVALENGIAAETCSLKINQRLDLRQGWNHFCGKVGAYGDQLAFYLTLPRGRGLRLCADREVAAVVGFRHSAPIPGDAFAEYCRTQPLPFPPEEMLERFGGWRLAPNSPAAGNPGRDSDLDTYGPRFEALALPDLQGHVFRKADYPEGFAIVLDLGHTRLFRTEIEAEGTGGALVDLAFTERLRGNKPLLYLNHAYHASTRVVCAGGTLRWSTFHPYGGRYVALTVRNPQADITLRGLRFVGANYPVTEEGAFRCSEPALNDIWEMCRRTQATNMEDAYVDCPTRERGMYGRDTLIQYHNNLAFFGDQALMRRCLELYSQGPAADGKFRAVYPGSGDYTIADFALNMVDGFRNYYENSGDAELIRTCWPVIRDNLQWFHELSDEREDGLLDADWPTHRNLQAYYGGYHGDGSVPDSHMCKRGPSCALTCTYVSALKSATILAELAGDPKQRRLLAGRHKRLKASVLEFFWDEANARFADDLAKTTHSIHANLLAVLAGIPSRAQEKGIRTYFRRRLRSIYVNGYSSADRVLVSTHFMFYLLDALYRLDLPSLAENLIIESWGSMLNAGLKTCREYLDQAGDSFCHAWSAHPGYFLSRHVLGVTFPKAPDLDTVAIDIRAERATWAEGAYPHPRGVIEVKWRLENGRRVIQVKAPEGVTVLPFDQHDNARFHHEGQNEP